MPAFIHGMCESRTYKSWESMKLRCNNKRFTDYPRYGGRGIKICKRWNNFPNFLKDMGERPEGKTLDRINTNGNYTKDNCRWASNEEQQTNRRLRHNSRGQYIHVHFNKDKSKRFFIRYKNIYSKHFLTLEEAQEYKLKLINLKIIPRSIYGN